MMDQMILRQTHWIFNDANLSKETFELGYQDYEKYDYNISFQMSFFSFTLSFTLVLVDSVHIMANFQRHQQVLVFSSRIMIPVWF